MGALKEQHIRVYGEAPRFAIRSTGEKLMQAMNQVIDQLGLERPPDSICPTCGLDRNVIKGMLAEPPEWDTSTEHPWRLIESQNHRMAVALLDNCWHCKEAIG